ncbi:MAG: GntR family transcriptional regulator [Rhodobacteraceae bacterium]|nr:GntR family transcriptional regulator [Paracoccaceae bacterium]
MADNLNEAGARKKQKKRAVNTAPMGGARFSGGAALTLSEIQYERLRAAIIAMDMLPGTPISEKNIALEQGISRTPIREAILRLTKEKLVEVVPKSGTFVARIPISSLPETTIARRALEAVTTRSAARYARRSQVLELHAVIERQRELAALEDIKEFHEADEDFHAMVATIGKLPGLWRLIQQVKFQVDRFRRLTLPEKGRMMMIVEEHASVVRAIEQKNEDLACLCMEKHLTGLQLQIATVADAHPNYFIHDIDLDDIPQI